MPTIVAYTDTQSPRNQYPYRIVSPSHAGPCCASHTEAIGPPERGDRWMYRYKRCRACGFTVRAILHEIPDAGLVTSLRETLKHSFMRNVPE